MSDFQNIERLVESSKHVSLLWKKQAIPKRSNTCSITTNERVTHFSKLLYNENAQPVDVDYINNESDEFLNADITIDAVKFSIKRLASGKSAGTDGLNVL